jgi:probable F420-dependent oxidoreductase
LGAFITPGETLADPDGLVQFGCCIEEIGLTAIWMGEHVVWFDHYESPWPYNADGRFTADPKREHLEIFDVLAFLAATTERVRLGTGITIVPQRNPVYTAKSVMSVDVLSKGRFDFGIGAGWNKAEFDVTGTPWDRRGKRTDEYLEVMRALWMDDPSRFNGAFYNLPSCHLHPKPVQRPHPPIHVSGHSPGSLDRAATYGQGWYGYFSTPDETRAIVQSLASRLHARDRTWENFQITVTPPKETVLDATTLRAYETAGVTLLLPIVSWPRGASLEQILDPLVQATRALSQ